MALFKVRQGALHGEGTFALVDLDEEVIIGEVRGRLIDDPDYDSLTCAWLDEERHLKIEPDDSGVPVHRMNHSCEPNCYLDVDETNPMRLLCATLGPVRAGEELTIDYQWPAVVQGQPAPRCHCGAATCRGWVVAVEELPLIQRP